MNKYDAQMRMAFAAVTIIGSEMADGDFEETSMMVSDAMESYLNLVGYISAHGMRHSGYTVVELRHTIEELGRKGVVTEETFDAVQHYLYEVTMLYEDEPIKCGKRVGSTKCECGWRSYSQKVSCQELA